MKKYWLLILVCIVILSGWFIGVRNIEAQTTPQIQNISGWAWSSNVGWIAFGSWPNRVRLETATGNILGYAWNNNIGWIRFDPSGPSYPNTPNHAVKVQGTNVLGWARACLVFLSGCSGALKSDIQLGGWDGWIKMSDASWTPGVTKGVSTFSGKAWGGDVIGWIDFCGLPDYCVSVDNLTVSCIGSPNPVDASSQIEWVVSTTGNSTPPLTYTTLVSPDGVWLNPASGIGTSPTITTQAPSFAGKASLSVEVIDSSTLAYGGATCSVDVVSATPTKKLSLNINGDGAVTSTENPNDPSADINCNSNIGACEDDYALNTDVTLTATANGTNVFRGWTGDVPGCTTTSTTSPCVIKMNQSRSVTATFWPSIPPPIDANTLGVSSSIIKIDFHNSGLSVRSPSVKISNNTDELLTFCVKEVISKVTDKGLNKDHSISGHASGTVLPPMPTEQLVRCYFNNDDNSDKTCDYTDANGGVSISSVTLAPKGTVIGGNVSDTADFSIMVPVKLVEIKDSSPYGVRIGVCGDSGTYDKYIEFQYQPLTFEPQ